MYVALTGTPGTGKTTISRLLPYKVIDINALVKDRYNVGWDSERECLEADMDGLEQRLDEMEKGEMNRDEIIILEGHISHYLADEAIVLRLAPSELINRLKARGYAKEKIHENMEAELVDVILVEAAERCSKVSEIDTTGKSPHEVATLVARVITGEIELRPGQVDWLRGVL